MNTPTNAELAQEVTAILTRWNTQQAQLGEWLTGDPEGGPNADGRYPLTNAVGETKLFPSLPWVLREVGGPAGAALLAQAAAEAAASLALTNANAAAIASSAAATARSESALLRAQTEVFRQDVAADRAAVEVMLDTFAANEDATVKRILADADATLHVDPTGSDETGDGSEAKPFATPQRAVDAVQRLTDTKSILVKVASGVYTGSSRAPADMLRPAVLHIDGIKVGSRTAQSGSTLKGGLVIEFSPGAIIETSSVYPRGIYVTGHCGSVGIVNPQVRGGEGGESLLVAHRGSYVHVRDGTLDGQGLSALGIVAEAGGIMEAVNLTVTGCSSDVVCYANSFIQLSGPAQYATAGNISNSGHVDLAVGMTVVGSVINRGRFTFTGTSALPVILRGNYDGKGGTVYGAYARFENAGSSIVAQGEQWSVDALNSAAQVNFRACIVALPAFRSYVSPATQSTHSQPVRLLEGSALALGTTLDIVNSAGQLVGPDYGAGTVTVAADGHVISPTFTNQHQTVRLNNTKGSLATGCTLSLESGWKPGQRVANGQMLTLVNLGGNAVQVVHGSTTVGLNGLSVVVGASPGARRSVTFVYLSDYGKWMPVSLGDTV